MADPVTLIVLVAAGDAGDATTRAMAKATREALGASAHVVVREAAGDPSDGEAIAAERVDAPDAVAELSWTDSHHRQASVRVHVARSARWFDRTIRFSPTDADTERGRTLGFAIASILPEGGVGGGEASASPATAPSNAPVVSTAPAGSVPPVVTPPEPKSAAPPSPSNPSPHPPAPSEAKGPASHHRILPELVGEFGGAFASADAGGFGGSLAAEVYVLRSLSLRVSGRYLRGSVYNPLDRFVGLDSDTWSVSGGIAFHPLRASAAFGLGCSLRVDWVFIVSEELTFKEEHGIGVTSTPIHATIPLYGAGPDAVVDLTWQLAPGAEVLAGGGGQLIIRKGQPVFSDDRVTLPGGQETWIPPFRAVIEAGFRFHF